MGQSATSQASTKDPNNAAQVQMQPAVMSPPTRGSDTSNTQVQVLWTSPASNGSPITSYELQYMLFGGSTWLEACGDATGSYLGSSYTITKNIVGGATYLVQIRAKNQWGWGAYSSPSF